MKPSFALTLLILLATACLGWRNHHQLVSIRERNATLLTEAALLGITPDPEHPNDKVTVTRQRESGPTFTAAEYIAFMKDVQAKDKKGRNGPDEETAKRILRVIDRLSSLDPDQLKRLVREVRASTELNEELRGGAIMISLMALADRHPQAALAFLSESEDLLPLAPMRKQFATSALSSWAKNDPMAAVKWIQESGDKYSDLLDDSSKTSLLSGVAAQDPKLAFQLIDDLKLQNANSAVSTILDAANTPEERTASLKALREYAATIENTEARNDTMGNALNSLASRVAQDGFHHAVEWINAAHLSPSELQSFGRGISYYSVGSSEAGQWVEWLGKNLPEENASPQIASLVEDWTEKDYQASGTWLTKAADGPAKEAAVRGYVEAVASYEPETAAQWAMTLPAGKDRETALKDVYRKWPKNDPAAKAAAEAFADQHGIKH